MADIVWKDFEGQESIVEELKSIFNKFSLIFPDAVKHLKMICSEGYNSTYGGYLNFDGTKIVLVTFYNKLGDYFISSIRETFIHELGHLLHMYFENSNVQHIIYRFTVKCRPRNVDEFPEKYALTDRFEAFACGFVEWWTKGYEQWSKYTKKLDKIINILNSKCKMTLDKIKGLWRFIDNRMWVEAIGTTATTATTIIDPIYIGSTSTATTSMATTSSTIFSTYTSYIIGTGTCA